MQSNAALYCLLEYVIGEEDAQLLLPQAGLDPAAPAQGRARFDRVTIARALCLVLVRDIVRLHAPWTTRLRTDAAADAAQTLCVCTVSLPGQAPALRPGKVLHDILGALGFAARTEPGGEPALQRTLYDHTDAAAGLPTIVLEQVQAAALGDAFACTAQEVFGQTRASLSPELAACLQTGRTAQGLAFHDATDLILHAARCFDRQHPLPSHDAYLQLAARSAHAAWVAAHGQAVRQLVRRVPMVPSGPLAHAELPSGHTLVVANECVDGQAMASLCVHASAVLRFKGPRGQEIEATVAGPSFKALAASASASVAAHLAVQGATTVH